MMGRQPHLAPIKVPPDGASNTLPIWQSATHQIRKFGCLYTFVFMLHFSMQASELIVVVVVLQSRWGCACLSFQALLQTLPKHVS